AESAQNSRVARAPAEVAGQRLARLFAARLGIALQERPAGDDDPERARAALPAAGRDEALEELARRPFGDPLDRLDAPALALEEGHQAGEDWLAFHHHRAGAALAFAASFLRAGQAEALAHHVEQALHRMAVHLDRLAVEGEGGLHGVVSSSPRNNRSGVAGISSTGMPVAFSIACTAAGAPPSIGSSPTPLAPKGPPSQPLSSRWTSILGQSLAVGMM